MTNAFLIGMNQTKFDEFSLLIIFVDFQNNKNNLILDPKSDFLVTPNFYYTFYKFIKENILIR